jgi:subtilisin family serine protease
MKSRSAFRWILVSAFLLAGCLVEPQDPAEIFVDQKRLPVALEELANPRLRQAQLNHLAKKAPEGRLAVAVIDEGVDYTHPRLFSQIRFDFSPDGKLVGAGHDFMGNDDFAHPTLINPKLYALTAESLVGSQLKGVSADPLKWLVESQKTFAETLLAEVKKDSVLAGSFLGRKLGADAIFFLAVPSLITTLEETKDRYEEAKAAGNLVNENAAANPKLVKKYGVDALAAYINEPWVAGEGGTIADRTSAFYFTENVDRLLPVLKAVAAQMETGLGLSKRISNYRRYQDRLENQSSGSGIEDAVTAWLNVRFNYNASSPILKFFSDLCQALPASVRAQLAALPTEDPKALLAARYQIVHGELKRQLGAAIQVYRGLQSTPDLTSDDRQAYVRAEELLATQEAKFRTVLTDRPYLARYLSCQGTLDELAAKDSALMNDGAIRRHPYVSQNSNGASHGSHVTGIIVRQSRKIDVLPVRVVTSSSTQVPAVAERLRSEFEKGFAAWLKDPDVAAFVAAEMKKKVGGAPFDLLPVMTDYLNETFSSTYLDFHFFDQIRQAIRYVGQRRVKVANMSLGTSFEKAIFDPSSTDLKKRQKAFAGYLKYEYFKFAVASDVEKYARNTLFVIASGNDGAWINGVSRSALPCDLSSPRLAQIQAGKPLEQQAPNNRLSNILCVGSIDRNDDLSAFMNLPVTGVPFVLSYGEAVLSAMKLSDCEGVSQELSAPAPAGFGDNGSPPSFDLLNDGDDPRFDAQFKALGLLRDGLTGTELTQERQMAASKFWMRFLQLGDGAHAAVVQDRCMSKSANKHFAKMSGTSMATPSVAGYIGKMLVREINSRHLSEEAIYDAPEYAPAAIIDMIRKSSPVFGGGSILKDIAKVVSVKEWNPAKVRQVVGVLDIGDFNPPGGPDGTADTAPGAPANP